MAGQGYYPISSYHTPQSAYGHKKQLVDSFKQFSGSNVSQESIALARDCMNSGVPRQERYEIVEFDRYLEWNKATPSYMTMMTSAYDLLLKYVINLLKVKRPQVWRSIKTNNTAFKARVACMKGAEDILYKAGYTEKKENSMCFPESVDEPDRERLSVIAGELLMAKLEVDQLNNTSPPQGASPRQQQRTPSMQQQQHTQPMYPQQMGSPSIQRQDPLQSMQRQDPPQSRQDPPQSVYYQPQDSYSSQQYPSHSAAPQTSSYSDRYQGYNGHNAVSTTYTSGSQSTSTAYSTGGYDRTNTAYVQSDYTQNVPIPQQRSPVPHRTNSGPLESTQDPQQSVSVKRASGEQAKIDAAATVNRPVPKPRKRILSNEASQSPQAPQPPPTQGSQPPLHTQSSDTLNSLSSAKSSSSGDVSSPKLSLSSSDDSPANIVQSTQDFLEEFRREKRKADEKKTGRTGFIGTASPQLSRRIDLPKASTSIHPVKKSPVQRTASLTNSPDLVRPGFKLPPGKKQPSFHDDTILESLSESSNQSLDTPGQDSQSVVNPPVVRNEPSPPVVRNEPPINVPIHTEPVRPALIRYCSGCKCKLSVKSRFCSYCGQKAPPLSSDPPVADEEVPLRASHVEVMKAEEQHKKTQSFDIDQTLPFTPVGLNDKPPQQIPPKIKPRRKISTPNGPPPEVPREAWGEPAPPNILPHSPVVQRTRQGSAETTGNNEMYGWSTRDQFPPPGALPRDEVHQQSQPSQNSTNRPPPQGANEDRMFSSAVPSQTNAESSASATSGSNGLSGIYEGFLQMPGVAHLKDKEEAYRQKQRRDGVKEKDLQRLGELVEAEQKFMEQRSRQHPQSVPPQQPNVERSVPPRPRKVKDLSKYQREDMSKPLADLVPNDTKEARRIDQLAFHGRALLDAVKECVPLQYSLDEIQIAYSQSGRGLPYLRNEWQEKTRAAIGNMTLYKSGGQYHIGTPSDREMRDALAKAAGELRTAEKAVFLEREDKVKQLLGKMDKVRQGNPNIPELAWNDAVQVLSANNMEVDTAFCVLQCDWLKPVHEYIFDEKNKKVNQQEMEEIKKVITNKEYNKEAHLRLLMAEFTLEREQRLTRKEAEIVLQLLEEVEGEMAPALAEGDIKRDYPLQYYSQAARDHGSIERARNFMIKECEICMEKYPVHEFVALPGCNHSVCKDCFKGHFYQVVNNQEVKHFTCPICGEPDMADKDITEGFYLQLLLQLVKENLDADSFRKCDEKLREFNLSREPNFLWCANTDCRSGFIHEGRADDVACPNCQKSMCRKCQKPWERSHEGITCEAFAKWKIDNDPDAQEQGLAAHLNANGIECPQCHFKYDLAKGGCMHFKCVRCPNEFCSGCGQSFKKGQACGKLETCKNRGLHAHHPRDCLFYMRDFDTKELQDFLRQHKIAFDTESKAAPEQADKPEAEGEEEGEAAAAAPEVKGCRVMLQKETMEGLKDEECGRDVVDGQAGLCQLHYKEYLVDLINKNHLDPVTMYTTEKIELMLTREEVPLPERDDDDDDDEYREKLIEYVKEHLPLPGNRGAIPDPPQLAPAEPAQ